MEAPKFKTQNTYWIEQGYKYKGDDYWEWSVWLEAKEAELNKIDYVTYVLHPSFYNPRRDVRDRESKFLLKTSGWGTFTLYAKLHLKNGEELHLEHELHLEYPDGTETTA